MDRRSVLAGTGLALTGALAGCTGGRGGGSSGFSTYSGGPTQVGGVDLPVPRSELSRGAPKDAIPAITDPAFGRNWNSVDETLADDEQVIGVTRGGEARAYPLAILNWHEVVNDRFQGPLVVTYCPLCGSGVTARRVVDGEATVFGVSGLLWQSDLVMYDRATDSLWSQILGAAIRGAKTGTRLDLVASTFTTWGAWRQEHPDTEVLLPPPESGTISGDSSRNYDSDPYSGYDSSSRVGIGNNGSVDDRLHPKTTVIGVATDGAARAYTLESVQQAGAINDTVGDLPVVVAVGPDDTLVAYDRRVGGDTLSFERVDARTLRAGGSRFRTLTGVGLDGPHEDTELVPANDRSPMFWFAWADFHPDTDIYGRN